MPFPTKVQPIDVKPIVRADQAKPVAKSRLKRLIGRQLRISSSERLAGTDFDPSSVCLDKMVRNFMEDGSNGSERPSGRCGRSRCNCFHGSCDDSSDDELDLPAFGDFAVVSTSPASGDAVEAVKGLVVCASLAERNLLADASSIVEKSKSSKRRDEFREAVTEGLRSLGYNSAVCKSRWEKTSSFTAGKYEYIDVIVGDERLLVDVDFRSEFEIARPTKNYKAVLQWLPTIFVGKEDRVSQIVAIISEAARLSLKKKGLHYPPWRKPEYMKAKWLSPYIRSTPPESPYQSNGNGEEKRESEDEYAKSEKETRDAAFANEVFGEADENTEGAVEVPPTREPPEAKSKESHWRKPEYTKAKWFSGYVRSAPPEPPYELESDGEEKIESEDENAKSETDASGEPDEKTALAVLAPPRWEPPETKPRTPHNFYKGEKVVTGFASVITEDP